MASPLWTLSATIAYVDGRSENVGAFYNGVDYRQIGTNICCLEPIITLLEEIGFSTIGPIQDQSISKIVFRFSAIYTHNKLIVLGDNDRCDVQSNDTSAMFSALLLSDSFSNYFYDALNTEQTISFPFTDNLSSRGVGHLYGNAFYDNNLLVLTTPSTDNFGGISYNCELPGSFQATFDYKMSNVSEMPADAVYLYFYCDDEVINEDGASFSDSDLKVNGYVVSIDKYENTINVVYSDEVIGSVSFVDGIINEWVSVKITFMFGEFLIYIDDYLRANIIDDSYYSRDFGGNAVIGLGARTGAEYAMYSVRNLAVALTDDISTESHFNRSHVVALSAADDEVNHPDSIYNVLVSPENELIAVFEEVYTNYMIGAMSYVSGENAIYMIALSNTDPGFESVFLKISLDDYTITPIALTGDIFDTPTAMAYNGVNFIVAANDSLFTVTALGVVTFLLGTTPNYSVLYYNGSVIYGVAGSNLYTLDSTTGDIESTDAILTDLSITSIYTGTAFSSADVLYLRINCVLDDSRVVYVDINTDTFVATEVEEAPRLISMVRITDEALYGLTYHLDVGDFDVGYLYDLDSQEKLFRINHPYYNNNSAISWNENDNKYYRIATYINYDNGNDRYLDFRSYDPSNDTVDVISVSGLLYVDGQNTEIPANSYIADGGDDMYDDGNIIFTNLSDIPVQYTHTTFAEDLDGGATVDDFAMDGEIVDGSTWFGESSTYFTNMYPGLFVLCAFDINISSFLIDGDLGSDGFGSTEAFKFNVSIEYDNSQYTVYFKRVHNADDPSINHLIIVQGDGSDIEHTYSTYTYKDYDKIVGDIPGEVFYLLFSVGNGGKVDVSDAKAIATAFLNLQYGLGKGEILEALNSNYTNITNLIDGIYYFDDYSGDSTSQEIGGNDGILNPRAMVQTNPTTFLISSEFGTYNITTNGQVSRARLGINVVPYTGLAFLDDVLYGVDGFTSFLYIIDERSGDLLNQAEDQKANMLINYENNTINIDGLVAIDGNLMILSDGRLLELETPPVAADAEPITLTTVLIDDIGAGYIDITGVGVAPPIVGLFNPDGDTYVLYITDFVGYEQGNFVAEWNPVGYNGQRPPLNGWRPLHIASYEVVEITAGIGRLVVDSPEFSSDNITIRVKLLSPNSNWAFSYLD